jgi:hypothetical protein
MRQIYRVCLFSIKALSVLKWSVLMKMTSVGKKPVSGSDTGAGWESKKLFVDATYADIALLDISRVIVQFLYPLIITWSSKIYL